MNAKQVLVATLVIMTSSTVLAAKAPKTPVDKWTCGDFLEMDETYRPSAVFFAEGFTKSGKPVDAVMDVDGTLTVTPKLIEACTQNTKGSFVNTLNETKAKQ
ncbi:MULTISPECIES: acid-activated periplasmic chaperone HdeA [unclassified Pseudomonas]|jgi:acid stress chaperone HdeA|uniref:acid-activated periplasmic chaperone HdeA n=1 Tax=unclassified Pseudomonas TaxID=196821 RepID=UPI000BB3D283|nr:MULTISPECIES: acid-activated periplasmic chaperone HdeA [unclassified Pseudomonas]PBJ18297.1 Acid stress chaperone HdeA precursor [Pseudomonas sp. ACN8]